MNMEIAVKVILNRVVPVVVFLLLA